MRANVLSVALGVLTSAATILAACASAPRASTADGASGQAIYRAHCGSCHRLHDPRERTASDWARQLDRMAPRAHLSGGDRTAVLDYLSANAKDAGPSS